MKPEEALEKYNTVCKELADNGYVVQARNRPEIIIMPVQEEPKKIKKSKKSKS